jgi:hypothetical protein
LRLRLLHDLDLLDQVLGFWLVVDQFFRHRSLVRRLVARPRFGYCRSCWQSSVLQPHRHSCLRLLHTRIDVEDLFWIQGLSYDVRLHSCHSAVFSGINILTDGQEKSFIPQSYVHGQDKLVARGQICFRGIGLRQTKRSDLGLIEKCCWVRLSLAAFG